jgi:hypothetical protein
MHVPPPGKEAVTLMPATTPNSRCFSIRHSGSARAIRRIDRTERIKGGTVRPPDSTGGRAFLLLVTLARCKRHNVVVGSPDAIPETRRGRLSDL